MKHAAALLLTLIASPAFADAVTYKGTIGDLPVVVEFSADPVGGGDGMFGRYFYVNKGVDIPLHGVGAARGKLGFAEEVPCVEAQNNCPNAKDETPSNPPLGARWELSVARDGISLEGKFTISGRNRPVALERIGSREFDASTGLIGLTDFASGLFWQGTTLTAETSPYDHLKVTGVALQKSESVSMDRANFQYVTDPRTKFQFPRILDLSGYDIAPANNWLEQRHWMMTLDALWCMAQQYQGFGWNGYNYDAGTLGYWDEEQVEVHYLSAEVMSWTEGGSLSCGGAHPYNHYEFYNLDTVNGTPLDLSRIFEGWVARNYDGDLVDLEQARATPSDYVWGPDETLLGYVMDNLPGDLNVPDECPMDDLIPQNLAIGFAQGDIVRFALDGLPHVASACGGVLFEVPIIEITHLLKPESMDYFPALAD